jgi:hypothetical protein
LTTTLSRTLKPIVFTTATRAPPGVAWETWNYKQEFPNLYFWILTYFLIFTTK